MASNEPDILTPAIERNSAAVLSLPSAGMVRYYKSRFLRAVDERVWLEGVPSERALIESLIQSGEQVEVSFKAGTRKASFTSAIYQLDCDYRFFETEAALEAIQMIRPGFVKPVQRRTHYRVALRESDGFKIQLWRIAEQAYLNDEPPEIGYMPAIVRDLSVGGVGVMFPSRPTLVTDQRIRILLQHRTSPPMLLDGRSGALRKTQGAETFEVGIQFRDLQASLRGRQLLTDLTRIVATLQLEEAKRIRKMAG